MEAIPFRGGAFSLRNKPHSSNINLNVEQFALAERCEDKTKFPIVITDRSGRCRGLKINET